MPKAAGKAGKTRKVKTTKGKAASGKPHCHVIQTQRRQGDSKVIIFIQFVLN